MTEEPTIEKREILPRPSSLQESPESMEKDEQEPVPSPDLARPPGEHEGIRRRISELKGRIDLNEEKLFYPLEDDMMRYYHWFHSNPRRKVPPEVIYQGAGTEETMPPIHFSTIAPAYIIAGRYLRTLREKLGRPPRALEIGCGTGIGSYYLKTEVVPEADISAIDFSKEAISYAQANYGQSGVKYETAEAQKLPFEAGGFDVVLSVHVLEHIRRGDAHAFVNEIGRILRKGGLAIVITPNRELEQDLYIHNPGDQYDKRLILSHEHEYYREELRELFEGAWLNEKVFEEVQVNPQINRAMRKVWMKVISAQRPSKGILGNLKNKIRSFSREIVPLNVRFWLSRKLWETIIMKLAGVTYEKIVRGNEYYSSQAGINADDFVVVARR